MFSQPPQNATGGPARHGELPELRGDVLWARLALELIETVGDRSRSFARLVADDRVVVENGIASPPEALAGLLEVRGLGIFRLPFIPSARLRLVIRLGVQPVRLPEPESHPETNLPLVTIDPAATSAPARAALALEAACGQAAQLAGAFAA